MSTSNETLYFGGLLELGCLAMGSVGSFIVLCDTKLPSNAFSFFVKLLMLSNLVLALSTIVIQSPLWATLSSIMFQYLFRLYCSISVTLSLIPLYIIKYNGSIKNIKWKPILTLITAVSGVYLIAYAIQIKLIISIVRIIDLLFILSSAAIMIWASSSAWYILKVQQLERQDNVTRSTYITTEIYKHQAASMMMKLVAVFALIDIVVWIPLIIYMLFQAIYVDESSRPTLIFLYNLESYLFALNGLFHMIGFRYALRQWVAPVINTPKQVPVEHIIKLRDRNLLMTNQVDDTIQDDPDVIIVTPNTELTQQNTISLENQSNP
ncbi:hypothetical protein HDV02_004789 [Globomyces sp. JEL0801]|nr:hypothetical protein HDV02_004789 [Globomyces sp. JEL0801]